MFMQVAQVMNTDLAMISPDSSLLEGMNLIGRTNSDVLYLVDDQQHLKGIVPDFSLLKAFMNGSNLESTLERLLSPHISTISANSDISEVAPQFRDGKHCRMAVVENGRLIGQIERAQILAHFAENNAENKLSPEVSTSETNQNNHARLDNSHKDVSRSQETAQNPSLSSLLKR